MTNVRKPLIALLALGTAFAMPIAFAQDAATQAPEPQDPTAQPAPAAESATPQQLTWNDLDTDGNGTLSKDEAAPVQQLVQVFDDADADGDGQLTSDEYKAHVAQVNNPASSTDGGDD